MWRTVEVINRFRFISGNFGMFFSVCLVVLFEAAVCSLSVCLGVLRITDLNQCTVHRSIYDVSESKWSTLRDETSLFIISVVLNVHARCACVLSNKSI